MTDSLTPASFASFVGVSPEMLSDRVVFLLEHLNMRYRVATHSEREHLLSSADAIIDGSLRNILSSDRVEDWKSGWAQNRDDFLATHDTKCLIPGYVKSKCFRIAGKFVFPESDDFEVNLQRLIVAHVAGTYLQDVTTIYEFGCGTAINFLELHEGNPCAKIVGTDWVDPPGEIIQELSRISDIDCGFKLFDFFDPDDGMQLGENAAVVTITALEQVCDRHDEFLDFLIRKKPRLCVFVEPIIELLDQNIPEDDCAYRYAMKRGYLRGLYTALCDLQDKGGVIIDKIQRTRLGSYLTEAYTIIVWRPL